jgi:hypothetical protein
MNRQDIFDKVLDHCTFKTVVDAGLTAADIESEKARIRDMPEFTTAFDITINSVIRNILVEMYISPDLQTFLRSFMLGVPTTNTISVSSLGEYQTCYTRILTTVARDMLAMSWVASP